MHCLEDKLNKDYVLFTIATARGRAPGHTNSLTAVHATGMGPILAWPLLLLSLGSICGAAASTETPGSVKVLKSDVLARVTDYAWHMEVSTAHLVTPAAPGIQT